MNFSGVGCAQVTVEIGGSEGQRIYMLELKCLADTLAVMVTDTAGKIQFATSQMAAMIGYTAKALTTGVNMNALLPPPYAQLHSSFMKVGLLLTQADFLDCILLSKLPTASVLLAASELHGVDGVYQHGLSCVECMCA